MTIFYSCIFQYVKGKVRELEVLRREKTGFYRLSSILFDTFFHFCILYTTMNYRDAVKLNWNSFSFEEASFSP